MTGWQRTVVIIGGALAVISQFWTAGVDTFYLPLIGGALVLVGTFVK